MDFKLEKKKLCKAIVMEIWTFKRLETPKISVFNRGFLQKGSTQGVTRNSVKMENSQT